MEKVNKDIKIKNNRKDLKPSLLEKLLVNFVVINGASKPSDLRHFAGSQKFKRREISRCLKKLVAKRILRFRYGKNVYELNGVLSALPYLDDAVMLKVCQYLEKPAGDKMLKFGRINRLEEGDEGFEEIFRLFRCENGLRVEVGENDE